MTAAPDHRANGESGHPARVVVGEPDPDARDLIVRLLSVTGHEVHPVATGTEALEATRELRPEAVLLEVALPEISGYQVCHMLRNEHGDGLSILLLSSTRTEPFDLAAGLLLGANDYIAKPFSPDELVARVLAHTHGRANHHSGRAALLAALTPSEQRVLRLLAEGMSTKGIAAELSITTKTVGMHIHNAMKKLDVHSRSQAVALAHRLGVVDGRRAGDVLAHAEVGAEPSPGADVA